MAQSSVQLEMNFDGSEGNVFGARLDTGHFQILLELPLPGADTAIEDAVARYADMEYLALSRREPVALAFTCDKFHPKGHMDMVALAEKLCSTSRDRHLLYLTGRGRSEKQVVEAARMAAGAGFKNFCVVSGAAVPGESAAETRRRHFTESVQSIARLSDEMGAGYNFGCTVNPFKYTASDLCLQYFKLAKKINFGASFTVSQFGWDMMKLQEMRWNLFQRSLHIPAIARMLFLTPERAEAIINGQLPGILISADFATLLKKEMQFSRAQFEAAQLRRIQFHAIGAKLLGYSGIQLSGIDNVRRAEAVLDRIREAEHEFPSFDIWRSAWREYYARLNMPPYPHCFYMFEHLFESAQPPDDLRIADGNMPGWSFGERLRYKIGTMLFSHAAELPPQERFLTKKLLFSCSSSCRRCALPKTFYICPETCPKGMANGPCGTSCADGSCPFDRKRECIFLRQMRIVNAVHEYPALEEDLIVR